MVEIPRYFPPNRCLVVCGGLWAALLGGCSDYRLGADKADVENEPGSSDEDEDDGGAEETGSPLDESCEDPDLSAGTVSVDESCVALELTAFEVVAEWTDSEMDYVYATPLVGHLTDDDGDGVYGSSGDTPDIVAMASHGTVWVLSGDGSGVHWSWEGSFIEPPTPAIGDLDGDGVPEVVIGSGSNGNYTALHADGSTYWSVKAQPVVNYSAVCGSIAIHDLDADGQPEVILGGLILDGQTGAIRGHGAYGVGTDESFMAAGVAVDIDQDGLLEVVVGNALYDADGETVWANGEADGFPAVADFDADGYGEIVVASRDELRLQDDDGAVLWSITRTELRTGPPVIADFNGDGHPEIGVAGLLSFAVYDSDGSLVWSMPTDDNGSGATSASAFDFEGDGSIEVVYGDENTLWVFDGATGAVKLAYEGHASATCAEHPAIADVDGDGQAEIVLGSSGSGFEGITVLGDAHQRWMPAPQVWSQHAYWIDHIDEVGVGVKTAPQASWDSHNSFRAASL